MQSFVSTHAPARGATVYIQTLSETELFQPTHPHGVRRSRLSGRSREFSFQPTHPHGVRHSTCLLTAGVCSFQPTHPHGVRRRGSRSGLVSLVFQPTHPHGVRLQSLIRWTIHSTFQPTHPHGVRPNPRPKSSKSSAVSTHAPARGATTDGASRRKHTSCFNPRTRTGCDSCGRKGH